MRARVLAAAFAAAVTVGCSGEAVVQAQLEDPDTGETTPLAQLEIRYLPYDRDVIFDSLQSVASRPEPAAPDSLIELQAAIAEAQVTWSTATERWNSARDSLRALSARLDQLPRTSPQYRLLYRDFQPQEAAEAAAQRQMDASFSRYDDLQRRYTAQAQEYSLLRDQWGDEAFANVDDIIAARIDAAGREEVFDTTDMNGTARTSLPKGQWWVYARYELIYDELYWNVPLEVAGGEPIGLDLNRANAQRRPRY